VIRAKAVRHGGKIGRHQGEGHRGMRRRLGWELVRREIRAQLPGLKCFCGLVPKLALRGTDVHRSAAARREVMRGVSTEGTQAACKAGQPVAFRQVACHLPIYTL
jgi:hypothetical protein